MNNIFLVYIIIIIFLDAIKDAFNYKYNTETDIRKKELFGILFHLFNMSMIIFYLLTIYSFYIIHSTNNFLLLIIGYSLLRFGIFDFIYNITTNHHYLYIGNTSLYDKILRKIFPTANAKMILYLIKGISFITSLYIFQYLIKIY